MTEPEIDENGVQRWIVDGKLHRLNGPAMVVTLLSEFSSQYEYTVQYWYVNGVLHRLDGPAVEWSHGHKEWWVNGVRHREDGPAYMSKCGLCIWYFDGHKHRIDGPAEYTVTEKPRAGHPGRDYQQHWYLQGYNVSKEAFDEFVLDPLLNLRVVPIGRFRYRIVNENEYQYLRYEFLHVALAGEISLYNEDDDFDELNDIGIMYAEI